MHRQRLARWIANVPASISVEGASAVALSSSTGATARRPLARRGRAPQGFAAVGNWPRRRVRGQVHFRLSRARAADAPVQLSVGERRFTLVAGQVDAWAADPRADAQIIAAMRSASSMSVSSVGANGRAFADSYALRGAATAIDAAALGCARLR